MQSQVFKINSYKIYIRDERDEGVQNDSNVQKDFVISVWYVYLNDIDFHEIKK